MFTGTGTTEGVLRAHLTDPRLFAVKTASVFVVSLALVPLVSLKQSLPVLLYAGGLVVLHVAVLVAYFYRVRFRELDPDRRSLVARVVALAAMTYLLYVASSFEAGTPLWWLTAQMLALSLLHTVVLLLLMVRLERRDREGAASDQRMAG